MLYRSTRDTSSLTPSLLSFEEAVLAGLAPDGGLYIPQSIPKLPETFLKDWQSLKFGDLCMRLFPLFIDDIPLADLQLLIDKSYSTFEHADVTPVIPLDLDKRLYLLELFHGPTFAFKDVALQFLGNLFEYFLEKKNSVSQDQQHRITVIGATSGDTGGAAIYGLRNKRNINVFILHPQGRVSLIQEAQMTTVVDENVHNIAVRGTFDDCQDSVKALFRDEPFRQAYQLGAINSINWARILAQITYYFHSYFSLCRQHQVDPSLTRLVVDYAVPTGNFGDILAGFYAKRLGLPIGRLIIATNENDILHRFFETGHYERQGVKMTLSPAMDIQVSSNFERFLWYLVFDHSSSSVMGKELSGNSEKAAQAASEQIVSWMHDLSSQGGFKVDSHLLKQAKDTFRSVRVSNSQILETIRKFHIERKETLDPHTAIGVKAAETLASSNPVVCLATAHPGKFLAAVYHALNMSQDESGERVELNPALERSILQEAAEGRPPFPIPKPFIGILDRERRCLTCGPDPADIKQLIMETLNKK